VAALVAFAVLGTSVATIAGGSVVAYASRAASVAGFSVAGNVIEDAAGHPWYAHGVDRPSLEWFCHGLTVTGNGTPIPASDFTTMATVWHANTVRLALNQDFWLSSTGATVAPSERCADYITTVHTAVTQAEAAGLTVILDLHWSDEGDLTSTNVGQKCMADRNSITFWKSVAARYASDAHVMFELYNEPHDTPWSVWRNGGSFTCNDGVTYRAAGMQQLTDAVRSTGAANVVVIGGLQWAYDLSGLPSVGAITGGNVAYATHPYEWVADTVSQWDTAFGFLTASAPVIATEFGRASCTADSYTTTVLDYFRTHGMSYTVWAWYAGSCQYPSVISNAAGACVGYGCIVQADMTAYANGSQAPLRPAAQPLPPPPAVSPNIRFDFEDGTTQGWAVDWGSGTTVGNTTARAYSGTHSLAVHVPASTWTGIADKGPLPGLSPGMTVTYRVLNPAGVNIRVEPYAADSRWTCHYLGVFTAATARWTTATVTIPAGWTAVEDIGLRVDNSGSWSGTIWVDAISWG
jgi:hypothetical protein